MLPRIGPRSYQIAREMRVSGRIWYFKNIAPTSVTHSYSLIRGAQKPPLRKLSGPCVSVWIAILSLA